MYTYRIKEIRVIDGDTISGTVDLGFNIFTVNNFRLARINCPEIKGECRPKGLLAKKFTEDFISTQEEFIIHVHGKDKYGRWLATVINDDNIILNEELIKEGHATKYIE